MTKIAKLLGLPYPGGKEIEIKAKKGDENFFKLPEPLTNRNNVNFSFSGLKTHINILTKKNIINEKFISNLSASFQNNISKILLNKIRNAKKILD